eukprot:GEMP01030731.1.p1 GENE.GEMP01030731.1~~GEMP01030731.1.p1  ORF type:complete len:251 (+),score=46.84 GEMP01030731.1:166-918(+)
MNDVLALIQGANGDVCMDEELRNKAFRILRVQLDNRTCFDCGIRNPSWMSLSLGVWLCLECSGEHRSMGVHLTFVRSATLDGFTPLQMIQMTAGGNGRAREFFGKLGITGKRKDTGADGLKLNYKSPQAAKYRDLLAADAKRIAEENNLAPKQSAGKTWPTSTSSPTSAPTPTPGTPASITPAPAPVVDLSPLQPLAPMIVVPTTVNVTLASEPAATFGYTKQPIQSNLRARPIQAKSLDSDFDFDQFED